MKKQVIIMEGVSALFAVLFFGLRIVGVIVCANKAGSTNRSSAGWGIFGFFMPIIAMICAATLKPKVDWHEEAANNDVKTT